MNTLPDVPFDPIPLLDRAAALGLDAAEKGNSPIACIAVRHNGTVVSVAANNQWVSGDATAHAERLLITQLADKQISVEWLWFVGNAEPCSMCLSALIKGKAAGVVYGASAEPSMDPWLPAKIVVAASQHPLVLVGPVGDEAYTELVSQGRETAREVRSQETSDK